MDGASKVIEVPEPLKRKCELKQVLPVSVIQLLASAPHNETVRNVLLAHLKVPVPEELKSYKDIQDWIEFNIEPPKVPMGSPPSSGNRVDVAVSADEREHGRCRYSADYHGEGNVSISRDSILEAAAESEDLDEFWSRIHNIIDDQGVRDYVSMEQVDGSEVTSDHSVDDSDGIDVAIKPSGHEAVRQILQALDVDRYDELFG